MANWTRRLARCSGWVRSTTDADHETVAEQVIPYLSTHTTPKTLRLYLQDLIGTSPEAKELTEQYVADRFPKEAPPPPPPEPKHESPRKAHTKPVRITPSNVASALAASESSAPRNLPPTKEMLELDAAFAMLSMEPTSKEAAAHIPTSRRLCLCQGEKHALAPYAPLCVSCGLILCSALVPAPISPHSACPSCSASPILPSHTRTQLLSEMVDTRERLVEEQQSREAERRAEVARQRSAGVDSAFPTLGQAPAPAPAASASKRSRVLHLDMKTHKVTVSRPKEKPKVKQAAAPTSHSAELHTTAEDGSGLVHDYEDDGFRTHYITAAPAPAVGPAHGWAAVQPTPLRYVAAESRPAPLAPICSEVYTEVPDLATLLQRKPPGSSADTQRRSKNSAINAGVARAQGRKTGKPSKKR